MTNRREFLQAGVAATALPLAVPGVLQTASAAPVESAPRVRIYKAIFDERYPEGRAFGEQVAKSGVAAHAFADGDITRFWFDELDLLWRETPVAIAGLTQFGPMFVLDRLGRERGLTTVFRVEHRPEEGGLRHVMSGPSEILRSASRLGGEGVAWPSVMARAVVGCQGDCSAPAEQSFAMRCARPEMRGGTLSCGADNLPERIIHYYMTERQRNGLDVPLDGPLFTWVIAPKAQA
jgi:hypothetical protein